MRYTGNTILITGGSSGIGLALAERFLTLGNEVIICGRREKSVTDVKKRFPKIHTFISDTGDEKSRLELVNDVTRQFPHANILINNAGIQNKVELTKLESWKDLRQEILINVEGPMHLSMLFIPHFLKLKSSCIINVSSGLAFSPLANVPIYCATKAAIHSFTLSLRFQLKETPIEVVEIIPPAVRTNLGGSHDFGTPLDEYADSVIDQLNEGRSETTYEFSAKSSQASRAELDQIFKSMNK